MSFLKILLSIHTLLLVSSWFIGGRTLANQPSLKLKLMRLLLISCFLSPLIVHVMQPIKKPERLHSISLDALQGYANHPIFKTDPLKFTPKLIPALNINNMRYCQLFFMLYCLLILVRAYRVLKDLNNSRSLLDEAVLYRKCGRVVIKISERCHVPFSVYFFNKAYIVLPLSLLSSSKNVKIAIAHEGQHHRNGDCLWAYFTEVLRLFFFGNPGVAKWCRVLSELQEFACDEVLVHRPNITAYDYGECLFQVVQTVSHYSHSSSQQFGFAVGMALNKKNKQSTFIIRRITMLSSYPLKASNSLLLGIMFAAFCILSPICVAYSTSGFFPSPQLKKVDTSHLDPKIQKIVAEEIAAAIKQYHAKSGMIAAVDPNTGNIIAFAQAGRNKNQDDWKSRIFSPGSTIKPFIAAAAIDASSSSESRVYDCRSPYNIDGRTFTNYNPQLTSISLTEALSKSVNTCFIKVAQDTGSSIIRKKLGEFGFDMNSWWRANQSANLQLAELSIGENIPVTVETLTKAFAILAHKGHSFGPHADSVISETTANSVTHMLEKAVQNGTGIRAAISGVAVAGKTGTVSENADFAKGKHLSLFAGYVPAHAPRYVILIIIEDGSLNEKGRTLTAGGELAAPIFRNVAVKSLIQSE